ncbi:MAG TPA: DUF3891 family protein [Tepidisphaeraceae bacterium]|jgi:hypothetical protein
MIRRRQGSDFLLIAQHDHALLSGQLAESFGNDTFAAPSPRDSVITAAAFHDCGWPLHDESPTLNRENLPLDVFESPRTIAFQVWTASVEGAAKKDPYAGLLVSLHVLSLSVMATEHAKPGNGYELENPRDRFAIIKFQQRELERQENLRFQLGLRSEKTSHHTVAKEKRQDLEHQLQFNFAVLQVLDQFSLALCCTDTPMSQTRDIPAASGAPRIRYSLQRNHNDLLIHPWPFDKPELSLQIPACRVPARQYKDQADFLSQLRGASAEVINAVVRPAPSPSSHLPAPGKSAG